LDREKPWPVIKIMKRALLLLLFIITACGRFESSGTELGYYMVYRTANSGFLIEPQTGFVTSETGLQSIINISLKMQPESPVYLPLIHSSDSTEGTVSPLYITFTQANWNIPQTVTITGIDDAAFDGAQEYTVSMDPSMSGDYYYNAIPFESFKVINTDNDTAGITVNPVAGLLTTEAGGSATFNVRLNSQPSANVIFPSISSSDTTEGTVSPSSLTFTPLNWNTPQTVTVTGVNDAVADGNIAYTINLAAVTSVDAVYNGMNPGNVSVTNNDNDSVNIKVTYSTTCGIITNEYGKTGSFTVVLNSQPTANVTVPISSNNISEGTVSDSSLLFTTANWNTVQTVTVTGQDDGVSDGTRNYSLVTGLATSADPGYNNFNASDVPAKNIDNEDPAVAVLSNCVALNTTESGGSSYIQMILQTNPANNVVIPVSSSNTAEGVLSPAIASVTFTTLNWNTPQTVGMKGVNDFVDDGNQTYQLVTGPVASGDPLYLNLDPVDVTFTNIDNDTAGVTVAPTAGLVTTEAGGTAVFNVRLNSQPLADVTINLSSSNVLEGTISPASLTFTALNWNVNQPVTITGVDDPIDDGNKAYTIITAPASSADPLYNNFNASDVSVTNNDNDTAGITVAPTSGLVTTEAGGIAIFNVHLNCEPAANVTISFNSDNPLEGTALPASLTFTNLNWNVDQPVTITGVDDFVVDGNVPYTIISSPAVSADPAYSGLNPSDVSVTNMDND